jgi:hypothetical protein
MQAENTQNQYTPVEGGIKVWKQRVNSFGVSEPHLEALNLPISQKVEEVTKLLTSAQTIDELSWLWEQRNDFKVKSKDVEYKTLSKLFTEYEKLASAPFHNQEDAESVLNFSLSYQLVTPQLTEAI